MGLIHPAPPGGPAAGPSPAGRGLFRRLPWEIRLFVYLAVIGSLALGGAFTYFTANIPHPMTLRHKEHAPVVRILARDGTLLAERGGAAPYVPIDLLPRHLIDAVVAIEDRRFFAHRGVDPMGLVRAVIANFRARRISEGGSTLTQQLAKNLFLNSERTIARKLEELVLALWLEFRLSKRDILELYLNRVYFGGGAYGVEAASRRFFGKASQAVTLAEAAVLAGLLKAPSKFSPGSNAEVARGRARTVLARMVKAGLLLPAEAEVALAAPMRFLDAGQGRGEVGVEYAVDAVLERLPPLVGSETRELVVETTVEGALQRRAQATVHELIATEGRSVEASQAALIVLDLDGGIRAIVGGRAHAESQFNRALKAKRQPGSTFKPFVYLAALESGLTPDSIVQDVPILLKGWSPRNDDGRYRGPVTMREGLAKSINTVAVRLNLSVGPRRTAAVARRLGIRTELREDASLALGTSEVTLIDLTGAYGTLASGGHALEPHIITQVRTSSGQVVYRQPRRLAKTVVEPEHVGALNDMLNAALVSGTGRRAALAMHPAAGKTGTSQDFRDAWFVGFTAHYVGGVWIGNDDGRSMKRVMGGNLPARLWREVMLPAHEGRTPLALPGTSSASLAGQRAPASRLPADRDTAVLPRERIEPDFVERALEVDQQSTGAPAERGVRPARPSWLDTTVDRIRRWVSNAPG